MHQITVDDDAWDGLLSFIGELRVIPILVPELWKVQAATRWRPPCGWLAEKLAARPTRKAFGCRALPPCRWRYSA